MSTFRPEDNCPCCGLPDEADRGMVQCDRCDVWYHFRCAGVTPAVKYVEWICRSCEAEEYRRSGSSRQQDSGEEDFYSVPPSELSSLPSYTSQSIRQNLQLLDEQLQIRQKRLADEKALQERKLALEAEYVKQQHELREEHLKLRQELISSLRELSVGGSRVSARSLASMRSERVRQWMDQQQNPAENPTIEEPQGADPKFITTAQAQTLAPLRKPDVPQQRKRTDEEGENSNDLLSAGKTVGTGYKDDQDELRRRNSLSTSLNIEHSQGPCPTPRKLNEWGGRNVAPNPERDTHRPIPAPRNFADGLGQRSVPMVTELDAQQPCPASRNATGGLGRRHLVLPTDTQRISRIFDDELGQRSAPTTTGQGPQGPYHVQADFSDNHREVFGTRTAVHRAIPAVSRRFVEMSNGGGARQERLSPARNGREIRGRCYDPDGFEFLLEPYHTAAGGATQSQLHPPRYLGRDYGQPHFDVLHPNRKNNQEEFFVENESDRQGCAQVGGITPDQLAARHVLPRKLPIFSGNYEEWPLFISCYNMTTEACGYTNNENCVRLLECLREPALGHVRGRLLLPESVPKVIETLQRIYGRPEQLLYSLLTKVRRCNPPKSDRLESFISFSLVIEQLCDHLEATNLQHHLVNPLLLQELVDKIPPSTKMEWVRFKRGREQVTLRTFADFMAGIAEDANEAVPIVDPRQTTADKPGEKRSKDKGLIYTHDADMEQNSREIEVRTCRVCQSCEHKVRNCEKFKNLPIEDKVALTYKWKICKTCLNEHGDTQCRSKILCNVNQCRESHHPLMHDGDVNPKPAKTTEAERAESSRQARSYRRTE